MPSEDRSSMHNFVHQKNPPTGQKRHDASNDDLKVALPPTPGDHKRNKYQPQDQPEFRVPPSGQEPTHHALPIKVQPSRFDDTDASEADKTSTADRQDDDQEDGESSESAENDVELEIGHGRDALVPNTFLDGMVLSHRQTKIMMNGKKQLMQQMKVGIAWPDQKGDSYPSTSSAHLSQHDLNEEYLRRPTQSFQHGAVPQLPAYEHQDTLKDPVGASAETQQRRWRAQNQTATHQHERSVGPETIGFLKTPTAKNAIEEANAGFIFGKPPQLIQHGQQRLPVVSQATPVNAPALHDHSRTYQSLHHERHASAQPKSQFSRQGGHNSKIIQQEPPNHVENEIASKDLHDYPAAISIVKDQPAPGDSMLDHELPKLFNMDFQSLRAEPFDVDPKLKHLNLPKDLDTKTLPEKLESMAQLPVEMQVNFFKTLDIDQWEEAGEWFLNRFKDIIGKYTVARRERRIAARQFEDEIAKRHEVVVKKRKATVDALGEMKANGAMILQGTPKARKSK
ncbi:hypothetical protein M433DRAFT_159035 [Acidomyces richmondensis BFW]|nr:hypothetical protein M433DRAFT_159035 [Acidomyces richmondensis BFW]